MPTERKITISSYIKLVLAIFWIFAIILPLFKMLSNMGGVNIAKIIKSERFITALKQSLTVSTVSTLVSVGIAGLLSWCVYDYFDVLYCSILLYFFKRGHDISKLDTGSLRSG